MKNLIMLFSLMACMSFGNKIFDNGHHPNSMKGIEIEARKIIANEKIVALEDKVQLITGMQMKAEDGLFQLDLLLASDGKMYILSIEDFNKDECDDSLVGLQVMSLPELVIT